MNEKAGIKMLEKELVVWDQLLEVQEDLLEQERKTTCELKRLLKLKKEKNEKLAHGKEIISSFKSSKGALQDSYDVLQKTNKDLKVQFDALWTSTSKPSSIPETIKASTSNGCERCYNIDIDALCAQSQHSNIEQVLVESCDEAICKEIDDLKLDVKRLEQKVSILEKQAKAQPSQDNRRNMVNKLEKEKITSKLAPQPQTKPTLITRRKKGSILMKRLNMQGVYSLIQEGHT
jgi:predicted  nucleic acid-binding Zn-ribbon protein